MALAQNDPPSPFSSPGVTSDVSLEAFCTKYKISEADAAKLATIEYKLGNKIVESLADANWQTAGFSILGWLSFIAAHWRFCIAIREHTWK